MEELRKMKLDLIEFHKNYDKEESGIKLLGLIFMAKKKYEFKNRTPVFVRRIKFNKNKRLLRFFKRPCYVCGKRAEQRHHIIPLSKGGSHVAKRNIVAICKFHHAEIHPWLKKVDKLGEIKNETKR